MSYTVIIIADDGAETHADYSQQGWRDLRSLVTTGSTPELHHLAIYGWNDDLPKMKAELESLKGTADSEATNHSIELFLQAIAESGQTEVPAIILSQGLANPNAPQRSADDDMERPLTPAQSESLRKRLFGRP